MLLIAINSTLEPEKALQYAQYALPTLYVAASFLTIVALQYGGKVANTKKTFQSQTIKAFKTKPLFPFGPIRFELFYTKIDSKAIKYNSWQIPSVLAYVPILMNSLHLSIVYLSDCQLISCIEVLKTLCEKYFRQKYSIANRLIVHGRMFSSHL